MAKQEAETQTQPEFSTFDPALFMNQEIEGEMDTVYPTVPDGEYISCLDELTEANFKEVNGTPVVDLYHILDNPELSEKMGMERLAVKQSLFLDVDGSGNLAMGPGKNVKLARLRAAVGQNDASQTWNITKLSNAGPMRIKVGSKPDKDDPTIKYNKVIATSRL